MRKVIYSFLAVAFLVLSMVSLGGCGGSSNKSSPLNSNQDNNNRGTSKLSALLNDSDMASVYGNSEYDEMMNEFLESGSFDKMNPNKMIFCIPDEEAEKILAEEDEFGRLLLKSLLFDADKVKHAYEEEETIMLLYPDESFINKTLEAAGLESGYVLNEEEAPSGRLELFAFAKRTVGERTHTFTYHAACAENIVFYEDTTAGEPSITKGSSAEIFGDKFLLYDANGNIILSDDASNPSLSDKEQITGEDDESGILFSVDRWRSFYEWCASLTDWANEQELTASAIEIRAAADDDLTKISEAQNQSFEFPGNRDNYCPWKGDEKKVNLRRKSIINFSVYTCHSYRYHHDYYLVLATGSTIPQNFQDRTITWYWSDGNSDTVNYLTNYTGSFGFEAYITDSNGNSNLSVNEVALEQYVPRNVNKSTTHNEGMNWNVGGEVGVNKDGPSAKINGGVSFSSSKSWVTTEYDIQDRTTNDKSASAEWNSDVTGPSTGGYHARWGGGYYGVNATGASTGNITFDAQWVWRIDESVWGKFRTGGRLPMKVICKWQEGFCHGKGWSLTPPYHWDDKRSYPSFSGTDTMYLDMPAHCWVSQKIFTFNRGSGHGGFNILSEGKWTVSTNADWLHLSTTSGNETGDNQFQVIFDIDENNTGAIRTANITFSANVGSGRTETATIQINQSANN